MIKIIGTIEKITTIKYSGGIKLEIETADINSFNLAPYIASRAFEITFLEQGSQNELEPSINEIKDKSTNRYARYYALLSDLSKKTGKTTEELNQEIKDKFKIKSKNELDDKMLNSLIYDLEIELGLQPPIESYQE